MHAHTLTRQAHASPYHARRVPSVVIKELIAGPDGFAGVDANVAPARMHSLATLVPAEPGEAVQEGIRIVVMIDLIFDAWGDKMQNAASR
jgi:hypothetical protein